MPLKIKSLLTSKIFSLEDQQHYAQLSGDFNPIHVDPVAARRLIYGEPIVHGVHLLIWALNTWLESCTFSVAIASIDCSFYKPCVLDEPVDIYLETQSDSVVSLTLYQYEYRICKIKCGYLVNPIHSNLFSLPFLLPTSNSPLAPDIESLVGVKGQVAIVFDASLLPTLAFNRGENRLSDEVIAELSSLSYLVGMHAPGMHSLFSSIHIHQTHSHNMPVVNYEVTAHDERFNKSTIGVATPHFKGEIVTFIRPQPLEHKPFAFIKQQVDPEEFLHQKALVVGGSRGLGAITAQLLVAGGAKVCITYNNGLAEALQLQREIADVNGELQIIHHDVLADDSKNVSGIGASYYSHVYYFPTPFIFNGNKGVFSYKKYIHFTDFYVKGFYRIFERCHANGGLYYFYPSTVAIEERPAAMSEYVMAKEAGESLCEFLSKEGVVIYKPRLPRMETDQTRNVMAVENLDAIVILEKIRQFQLSIRHHE